MGCYRGRARVTLSNRTCEAPHALTKMEHYLVLTKDLDGTRDFYCRVLGMKDGFRPPLGFPGYWLYLGTTPVIHIAEWQTYTDHSNSRGIPVSTPAEGTGAFDHIAFVATDYEELLESLRAQRSRALSQHHQPERPATGVPARPERHQDRSEYPAEAVSERQAARALATSTRIFMPSCRCRRSKPSRSRFSNGMVSTQPSIG